MNYDWIDEYCLAMPGAEKDYKIEWEAHRYLIGGKMFVMEGHDGDNRPIITVKCEPPFGRGLREQYSNIIPGYYMNKEHWNSVYMDGDVPDSVLQAMIDMSYKLVFDSLSKKIQKAILEAARK